MLKVKRGTWHYKLANLGSFESDRDSVCRYFWSVVLKLGMFACVLGFLGFLGYQMYLDPVFGIVFTWIITTVLFPTAAIVALRIRYDIDEKRLPGEKYAKDKICSFTDIIIEKLCALKDWACPLIEYID